MDLAADHPAFLADFGVPCTSGGVAFVAILDLSYAETLGATNAAPLLTARAADLLAASLAYGSALTVGGVAYTAREIQPDGTGMATVVLERA